MDSKNEVQTDRLMGMTQAIDRVYEAYAKAKGMTYMSMTLLETIYENPDCCTQKLICELTHYPKQSVNQIIKAFLENEYVELKELSTDRRNKNIAFTEKGKKYADEVLLPLWEADKKAAEQLGEEQMAELMRLTTLYNRLLCDNIEKNF